MTTIPVTVHAGELQEIVLIDGSIIVGELVSLTNGIYTIKTATLGDLKVEDARVKPFVTSQVEWKGQRRLLSNRKSWLSNKK